MTTDDAGRGMSSVAPISGLAAGVPFVVLPPVGGGDPAAAPLILGWHLMDPPRSEAAFAAALPLAGLNAWRAYLGLPMFSSRMPPGGIEEIMRLASEDAVLNLYGPVCDQALAEFEPALDELRRRFNVGSRPVGLLGGSAGAAIAQLVVAESSVEVAAAVLVSPVIQLRTVVDALSIRYGARYEWMDAAQAIAHRVDFVARAEDLARRGQPAIRMIVGENDDACFRGPATALKDALQRLYSDPRRVDVVTVPNMAHALAEEPGLEPAPQTPHAAEVDRLAVDWFSRHLRPN